MDLDRLAQLPTESIEEIRCNHVLEHIHNPEQVWCEFGRILKTGGRLEILVPHFSRGWLSGTHKRAFSLPAFEAFEVEGYAPKGQFILVDKGLRYAQHTSYNSKEILIAAPVLNWLAGQSTTFCERVWCYWVGGFDEAWFVYEKA